MEPLNEQIRRKLREIIVANGPTALDEIQRLEGLLRDQCGQYKREIRLLINALKEGIVEDLRSGQDKIPLEILLPRLYKKYEENLLLSPDAAKWAVDAWAMALAIVPDVLPDILPDVRSGLSTRQGLDNILRSPDYTPSKLIEFFKRDFGHEFLADAGVWEGYTVERHTFMVMQQFEKYFSRGKLPGGFDKNTFRVILVLHDIGVAAALEEGTELGMETRQAKLLAQKHTKRLMESALRRLGFSREEINIALSLISGAPIGRYLKSGGQERAAAIISRMAQEAGMRVHEFFDLLLVFYMVDAGSYTKDAGGLKALDYLFVFDRNQMKMTLASDTWNKVQRLRTAL